MMPCYALCATLQNAAALLKKDSVDANGVQKTSARVVFIGTKCCLQIRERNTNLPWKILTEKGPDEVETTQQGDTATSLTDIGNSTLIHDHFPVEVMRGHIQNLLGGDLQSLQILRIEPKRNCTKIVCQTQEAAKAICEGLTGKQIPGTNKKFSGTYIPI